MTGSSIVYVLDPFGAELKSQTVPDLAHATIMRVLSCDAIDTLRLDHQHAVYFNDEGLRNGISHYIRVVGHPDPIVGRLLLAAHPETYSYAPLIPLEEAVIAFELYRPVMDPIIKSSRGSQGDMTTFVSAVEGFSTRLERFPLSIRNPSS